MRGFLGMSNHNDWPADARPKSWREMILWLWPNGAAPLTALTSQMAKEQLSDYHFNWFSQEFPEQFMTVVAGEVYTDPDLGTALAAAGTKGQVLHIKPSGTVYTTDAEKQNAVSQFKPHHQVTFFIPDDLAGCSNGKVLSQTRNGANSYVTVQMLEADDNSNQSPKLDIRNATMLAITGNINPQGGVTPIAVGYQPVKHENKTQIFRTSIEASRTAMKMKNRLGANDRELKKELALNLHAVEMEKAFLLGQVSEETGDNGQPETTTQGIITHLRENKAAHVRSYANAGASYGAWTSGGWDWLMESIELLTRNSSVEGNADDWLVFCGSEVVLNIEKLAKQNLTINIDSGQDIGFGFKVQNFKTSFGTFPLRTHPLFSQNPHLRNVAMIFKPRNLKYRFVDDTQFYETKEAYASTSHGKRMDGVVDEWLTESGLEIHHPSEFMILQGFGKTAA